MRPFHAMALCSFLALSGCSQVFDYSFTNNGKTRLKYAALEGGERTVFFGTQNPGYSFDWIAHSRPGSRPLKIRWQSEGGEPSAAILSDAQLKTLLKEGPEGLWFTLREDNTLGVRGMKRFDETGPQPPALVLNPSPDSPLEEGE